MALGNNLTKRKTKENVADSEVKTSDKIHVGEDDSSENAQIDTPQPDTSSIEETKAAVLEQFCVFKSGKEEYAIPIHLVKEVVPYPEVAKVPQMPPYLLGMSNVRGNIYGVLDLNLFFNAKIETSIQKKFFLVLDHDIFQMGIAIPEVPNTLLVTEEMIEKLSTSRLKSTIGQKYLKGIIKKDRRMIILFDILGMISSDKFTLKS